MIKVTDLTKRYDSEDVLKKLNFEIRDNEIMGLVGESGAGKTTLLDCLTGIEKFQEGSIDVDGTKIETLNDSDLRAYRKQIGMIFQNFSLLGRKTVYQNIALPMQCWHESKGTIDKKVKELAEVVGLGNKLKSRPAELSGGQKQRVAIARALTMDPKYLICDECTSSLDPKTTQQILDLIVEIRKNLGITVVMVTHEMEVIRQVCDRMAILRDGEIIKQGNVKEMFWERPEELLALLGEEPAKLEAGDSDSAFINYYHKLDEHHKTLLSDIAKEARGGFELANLSKYEFSDGDYCEVMLNVSKADLEATEAVLTRHNVEYKLVEG